MLHVMCIRITLEVCLRFVLRFWLFWSKAYLAAFGHGGGRRFNHTHCKVTGSLHFQVYLSPTSPLIPRENPCLSTRRAQEPLARRWHMPHAHMNAMKLLHGFTCIITHILAFSCLVACVWALCLAFREPPISAVLGKRGTEPPAVALAHVYRACIFPCIMVDVHAACHAARAHVEHARGRSPLRARPGSRLPGRPEAKLVRLYACSLRCMPLNTILNVHAAWHAKTLLYRFERLANPTDSRNALSQRPTLSDLTAA